MSVKIALLGEVAAQVDGRLVDLGPPRQRCVLAALEVDQPAQAIDLLQFRALRDQARGPGEDTREVTLLTEALASWHG